jgi:hypothetical protein
MPARKKVVKGSAKIDELTTAIQTVLTNAENIF